MQGQWVLVPCMYSLAVQKYGDRFYEVLVFHEYHNVPPFSDRQTWANSADPDLEEQSDQCLHCLPFCLHVLDALLYRKPMILKFYNTYSNFFASPNF